MLSFPSITSLFLLHSLASAHTERFIIVKSLADQAGAHLDLAGKQSYAIYELCTRQHLLPRLVPYNYHMRLINGHVKCEDEDNCDFIGYAFDITILWGLPPTTIQASKHRPWIPNHYYDKEVKSYVKLPILNRHEWAGPTRELSWQQIYDIGMCIVL